MATAFVSFNVIVFGVYQSSKQLKFRTRHYCDDNGLRLLVNAPTRITEISATQIGLCFSNIDTNKFSFMCVFLSEDLLFIESRFSYCFVSFYYDEKKTNGRNICIPSLSICSNLDRSYQSHNFRGL